MYLYTNSFLNKLISAPPVGAFSRFLFYDPNSNITRKGTDTYIYDQLNQVTQSMYGNTRFWTGMQGNGYDYDLMGNRYNEQNIRIVTMTGTHIILHMSLYSLEDFFLYPDTRKIRQFFKDS